MVPQAKMVTRETSVHRVKRASREPKERLAQWVLLVSKEFAEKLELLVPLERRDPQEKWVVQEEREKMDPLVCLVYLGLQDPKECQE